jgi:hypothetical protein
VSIPSSPPLSPLSPLSLPFSPFLSLSLPLPHTPRYTTFAVSSCAFLFYFLFVGLFYVRFGSLFKLVIPDVDMDANQKMLQGTCNLPYVKYVILMERKGNRRNYLQVPVSLIYAAVFLI